MQDDDSPEADDRENVLSGHMTQPELAAELRVSVDSLQRWHNQRIGPPRVKVGGRVYYRRAAVRAWLRDREGMNA